MIDVCSLVASNRLTNSGVNLSFQGYEVDSALDEKLHKPFGGSASRTNYLSTDCVDIQCACEEVCRYIATPTNLRWKAFKRIGRYLCRKPRLLYAYPKQELDAIDVHVDTDLAGCARTHKCNSGGLLMLSKHTLKHWLSTLPNVALSSGEA